MFLNFKTEGNSDEANYRSAGGKSLKKWFRSK